MAPRAVRRSMGIEVAPPPETMAQPLKRKEKAPTSEQVFGVLSPQDQASFEDLYALWSTRKRIRVLPRDGWLESSVAIFIREERRVARNMLNRKAPKDERQGLGRMPGTRNDDRCRCRYSDLRKVWSDLRLRDT